MIGENVIRVDGRQKVTGQAEFGADVRLQGMLHAACRYTPLFPGRVTRLDVSAAAAMPGVAAIATCADVPGARAIGPIRADHYPLVDGLVFCEGDVVAVVAAETPDAARRAAAAIEVEVQPTEGQYDPVAAAAPGAPDVRPDFPGNVILHYPLRKGDPGAAFADCAHVIEREYRTGWQEHAYLEPESITAAPDHVSGGVTLLGSIQNPYTARRMVAAYMGLPLNRVNVAPSNLGGSFGGKDDTISAMACRAALLCGLTGRPVQLTYSREESIRESYKRHPYVMRYKVGCTADGKLLALSADILADAGAYSSQTFFVTWRSLVQATGPYAIPNVRIDVRGVYTNNPYTGAFRGYGSPQVIFAQESLMDELAAVCGLSPLELRRRNMFRQGAVTATGQQLGGHVVSLSDVLSTAVTRSDYERKRAEYAVQTDDRYRRGIGLACSFRGCSLGAEGTDATSALVSAQADGSVCLATALHENGQGLRTTYAQIAAEVLGVPLSAIVFLSPQTSWMSDGGATVASRGTLMGGRAVELAARKVRAARAELLAPDLGEDLTWAEGRITAADGRNVSFAEACARAARAGVHLAAFGWYKAPSVSWDEEHGQGDAYFTYVYGCQVAEVTVDTVTGRVAVDRVTVVHDAGRVINPLGARGQVVGGVTQGMGYAVTEDLNVQSGVVKAPNYDEYLVPTVRDAPQVDAVFIENADPVGPFGAKSLGEPTLELTAAAITNAVENATGVRHREIPLTLERVRLGHALHKPQRQSEAVRRARFASPRILVPNTLAEALEMLAQPGARALAGGTDVYVALRGGHAPATLVSLHRLPELTAIDVSEREVRLGAAVTMTALARSAALHAAAPLLAEAAAGVGSLQVRNRATLAGNLCNAAPCADTVPPLLALNAVLELRSAQGMRSLPVGEFVHGAYRTALQPGELLTAVVFPRLQKGDWRHLWEKTGRRAAVNISRQSLAALLRWEGERLVEARLAAGSLLDRPCRLTEVEAALLNAAPGERIAAARDELERLLNGAIGGRWSAAWKIPVFLDLLGWTLHKLEEQ